MKEYDCVQLIVDKKRYAESRIYKGMYGTIVLPECKNGAWEVEFHGVEPWYDEKGLFQCGIISVKEEDLLLIKEY